MKYFYSVVFRRILVVFVVGLVLRCVLNYIDINMVKEYSSIVCLICFGFIPGFVCELPNISFSISYCKLIKRMVKVIVSNFMESNKDKMILGGEEVSINSKDLSKNGLVCKQDRNPESSIGSGSRRGSGSSSEYGSESMRGSGSRRGSGSSGEYGSESMRGSGSRRGSGSSGEDGSESMRGSSSRRGSSSSTSSEYSSGSGSSSEYSSGSENMNGPSEAEYSGSWRYSNEELFRVVHDRVLAPAIGVNEVGTGSGDLHIITRAGSYTIPSAIMFRSSYGYEYWEYLTPQREYITQYPWRLYTGSNYRIIGFRVMGDTNPIWRLRDSSGREYWEFWIPRRSRSVSPTPSLSSCSTRSSMSSPIDRGE